MVEAAGGVVFRSSSEEPDGDVEVLVVHRPHRADWSLPKGKLDDGESFEDGARREVREETGFECELLDELPSTEYVDRRGRDKVVRYWAMRVVGGEFRVNSEVDRIRWVRVDEAGDVLTYERDRAVVEHLRHPSVALT